MLKFTAPQDPKKETPTGMEMMLRSMGLGQVIDMAHELAASGSVPKIIAFADGVSDIVQRLDRIERALAANAGSPEPYPGSRSRGDPPGPEDPSGSYSCGALPGRRSPGDPAPDPGALRHAGSAGEDKEV